MLDPCQCTRDTEFARQTGQQLTGKARREPRIKHLAQDFRLDGLAARTLSPGRSRQMLLHHAAQRADLLHHFGADNFGRNSRHFLRFNPLDLRRGTWRQRRRYFGPHRIGLARIQRRKPYREIIVTNRHLPHRRRQNGFHVTGRHGHDFNTARNSPVGQDDGIGAKHLLDLAQSISRGRRDEFPDVHTLPPIIEVTLINLLSGTSLCASTLSWEMPRRKKRDSSVRRLPGTSSTGGKPSSS